MLDTLLCSLLERLATEHGGLPDEADGQNLAGMWDALLRDESTLLELTQAYRVKCVLLR